MQAASGSPVHPQRPSRDFSRRRSATPSRASEDAAGPLAVTVADEDPGAEASPAAEAAPVVETAQAVALGPP